MPGTWVGLRAGVLDDRHWFALVVDPAAASAATGAAGPTARTAAGPATTAG